MVGVNVIADIKTVMAKAGQAAWARAQRAAKTRPRCNIGHRKPAARRRLHQGCPRRARSVTGGWTGHKGHEAVAIIKEEVDPAANIIVGTVINPVMSDEILVTVIATGFDEEGIRERVKRPVSLKEYRNALDKPKRKQESFDFRNEDLGLSGEDLDKPTFLRRQAD
jgi:cell division protein FtsZ